MRTVLLKSLICFVILIWISGCFPIRTLERLPGTYEMVNNGLIMRMKVMQDGTFKQYSSKGEGWIETNSGTWSWSEGRIGFSDLLIPRAFTPTSELELNDSLSPDSVKSGYAIQGYLSVSLEYSFGKLILPMFPDSGVNFVKVSD